jgi:hypothetical protein
MDEKTRETLNQIVLALKAFAKSVEKSFHMGMYDGTGDMLVKQYRSLHGKVRQLLPEDFYINEILVLDAVQENTEDEKIVSQIMLVSEQLLDYIQNLLKAEQQANTTKNEDDLQGLSQQFTEHMMNLTRRTLKRALANFDVEVDISGDPQETDEPDTAPNKDDQPES